MLKNKTFEFICYRLRLDTDTEEQRQRQLDFRLDKEEER